MSTNKSIIRDYLNEKGFSELAIAGIMGNIQQESNFETTATNSSSGAYGLFQWLGSRKTGLENYAKNNNSDVSDIHTQLDYFWYELQTTESATLKAMNKKYLTAGKYAEVFESTFERSGGSAIAERKSYAEQIWLENASGVSTETLDTAIHGTNNSGLKWWGDIVRVVFVLLLILGGVILGAISINGTVQEIM